MTCWPPDDRRMARPRGWRCAGWHAVFALAALLAGCGEAADSRVAPPEPREVTFAVAAQPISAPVYIADSLGFFERVGLTVEVLPRPTGETSLAAVREGRAHYATTAETPVVHALLDGDSVAVLGTVATTRRGLVLAARPDRGVEAPEDLRGRRIGVTFDINAEFFLDLFLTLHGLSRDGVELVDVPSDSLVAALVEGRVDAVVAWAPLRGQIRDRVGDDAPMFSAPELYTWFWNVVAHRSFSDSAQATSAALLEALREAVAYMERSSDESAEIVMKRLDVTREEVEAAWSGTRFIVSLDQALVVSMEDQALWLLSRGRYSLDQLPNVLGFIDPGPLSAVAPAVVSIPGMRSVR